MKKIILFAFLILVAAGAIFYYGFPEKTMKLLVNVQRSRLGLTQKAVQVDNHRIVYYEGGTGPTIMLLHGYTADHTMWLFFAGYLKDYHLVIPDIPGFGDSTKLPSAKYDLTSQIERLHKFVRALGIGKFHIAGNSMGGWFSSTYAARYPDEVISVGLFDAAGVRSPKKSPVMLMMEGKQSNPLLLKDAQDLPRLASIIFANPPFIPYPLERSLIRKATRNRTFHEKIGLEIFPDLFSLEKEMGRIKAPTLILWGEKDRVFDVSSVSVLEQGIKEHKTEIITDSGHCPMVEKPRETAAAYLEFLDGVR